MLYRGGPVTRWAVIQYLGYAEVSRNRGPKKFPSALCPAAGLLGPYMITPEAPVTTEARAARDSHLIGRSDLDMGFNLGG